MYQINQPGITRCCFNRTARSLIALVLGVVLGTAATAQGGAAATFESLTNLRPDGEISLGATFASEATGVSADGLVVVGFAASENSPSFDNEAFRWTASSDMTALGFLGKSSGATASFANSLSGDGSVVVGNATSPSIGTESFRWTQSDGIVGIGVLNQFDQSVALDASFHGNVVVGESGVYGASSEAYRWTQAGGMVGLGDLDGGETSSRAEGVSADGSVVVGQGTSNDGVEAFRWTSSGGMVGLGDLPGGEFQSTAHGVSHDGTVVVGESESGGDSDDSEESFGEAFKWTDADGIMGLGDLDGGEFDSVANAASAHGVVVVGRGTTEDGSTAFRYTEADGMRSIQDILVNDFGTDLTDWRLAEANGVSGDGRTIVGLAFNPDGVKVGFVATIPLPDGVSEEALGDVNDGGASTGGGGDNGNGGSGNGDSGDGGGNTGGNGGTSMPSGCGVATVTSFLFIALGLCGIKGNRQRVRNAVL